MGRVYRHILFAAISLSFVGIIFSAPGEEFPSSDAAPWLVRSWQTEQGLPHNMVLAITQTRDGYLWLGTANGLARFDGVNCRVFGLQDGLHSLEISALLEDDQGALWIGTVGGGLSRYFHGVIKTFTTRDGLNGDAITALLPDADGIWVGTTAGLYRWQNDRFISMTAGMGMVLVRALARDQAGAVWMSTVGNGLLCFADGKSTVVSGPPGFRILNAWDLLVDRQGRLWAGSQNGVILCRENGQWTKYGPENGLPEVYIDKLAQTADGTVWAGTLDEGLYYLKDGKFTALRMQDGLSDDAICSLFVDRQQNLWVGTRSGGLDRVNPRKLLVCRVLENGSERLPLSLAQTTNGDLWVGASGRGIYHLQNGIFTQLLTNLPVSVSGHMFVGAMLGARDGSLWWGAGPALFQWKSGTLLADFDSRLAPWLRGDRVLSFCENPGGGMWVGTYNGQLQLLHEGQFNPVPGLPQKPISALAQSSDGALWVGFLGGGLERWQNGALTSFSLKDGLRSDLIRALYLDAEGTLWIGTISGGLGRWSHGRLDSFTTREGLIDDTVLQILEDDDGNLWLGCNRGIYRVSKRSLEDVATGRTSSVYPLAFGNPEGMISEQCEGNFGAALKTQSGRLCFSTAKGIVVIDPRQQTNTAVLPVVLMEDTLVDGQPHPDWFSPDNHNPPAGAAIPAGRHAFEFHFTGLNFAAPEKIRFRYRLENLDPGWVEAGASRVARYAYVPPGKYHFQVTACNGDGHWNPAGAEISFVVLPHFWQTSWFLGLIVVALVGSTAGGIRYWEHRRYQARLRQLEQERVMEEERARIARDLHDELGSSLTRISMLSDLGQARESNAEQLTQRVEKISHFAISTARSLDEIVWAVNPRNDSLRSLLEYLTQFARELFEDANVHCRFHIPDDLPRSLLLPEMRHHVFLAVKEALTNALKHARATEVTLGAQIVRQWIRIVVQDNGAGFDPALVSGGSGRSGLNNMRQRIETLGGRFSIETAPGQGTTVLILIPCPEEAPEVRMKHEE